MSNLIDQDEKKNRDKFHHVLLSHINTYVNGSVFSKYDLFISLFFPKIPFIRHARCLIKKMQNFRIEIPQKTVSVRNIQIEPYKGKNVYVHEMIDYLNKHLRDDLLGAYVHGSLGTYEEINYSDFDSLIVLKNEVFEATGRVSKVAIKLNSARSFMFDFDPLQHHGWFVLTEVDLKYYPEYYFPSELFKYAKSLFYDKGLNLNIRAQNPIKKYVENFNNLSLSIIKLLSKRDYPKNMYQLKRLLSQFMLLPALYIQVRDKKSIYKKLSFEEAKKDFSTKEWAIMDEVTLIRENWTYKMSSFKKFFLKRPKPISRFLINKFAPSIPIAIGKLLTDEFYKNMKDLVFSMQEKVR